MQCPNCGDPIDRDSDHCPQCLQWFTPVLIARIRHPDAAVREAAVNNLVFVESTLDVINTLAVALNDSDEKVRRAAGAMLFTVGSAANSVIAELVVALDSEDYYVRRTSAATLSLVGPQAVEALPKLRELMSTSDELLRGWVAHALNQICDDTTYEKI